MQRLLNKANTCSTCGVLACIPNPNPRRRLSSDYVHPFTVIADFVCCTRRCSKAGGRPEQLIYYWIVSCTSNLQNKPSPAHSLTAKQPNSLQLGALALLLPLQLHIHQRQQLRKWLEKVRVATQLLVCVRGELFRRPLFLVAVNGLQRRCNEE